MSTPILPFARWLPGTNQNSIPANDNSLRNQILNGLVISDAVTSQPGSPVDGDIYILPATHTGAQWATFDDDDLVIFSEGTWYAFTPTEGVVVNMTDAQMQYLGGSNGWILMAGGGGPVAADDVTYDNAVSGLTATDVQAAIDEIAAGASSGDVVGPASSVSGRVAIFNGTTGKLLQDGGTLLSELATQAYVDSLVQGLSWKKSVRAASTGNGTLASAFENGDTLDGVTLVTGDRILLKNQSTGSENGIYTVNASGAPTRATDADTGAELVNATVYVSEGTTLADTQWTCTTNAPITVGSTSLAFAQLSSGGGAVTSVDAANGVETTSGSAITSTGTIQANELVNAQTGTTYTVLSSDRAKLVTLSNAASIAVTLPQATSTFGAGWFCDIKNVGVGAVTITPTTSTINGAATLRLITGESVRIISDGTNYQVLASVKASTIPLVSKSAAYTLIAQDAGGGVLHPAADTTARTMTIPANSSVPYPVNTALTFVNQNGAGVMTIAITTDTMRLAGSGTTGSRTLAANGIATALKITSTEWLINGTGLS